MRMKVQYYYLQEPSGPPGGGPPILYLQGVCPVTNVSSTGLVVFRGPNSPDPPVWRYFATTRFVRVDVPASNLERMHHMLQTEPLVEARWTPDATQHNAQDNSFVLKWFHLVAIASK